MLSRCRVILLGLCLGVAVGGGCRQRASSVNADGRKAGADVRLTTVTIAGEEFTLEVAADEASQERGLAGRAVDACGGMLFVFAELDEQMFVMRDCAEALDLIYLDAEERVTCVHAMAPEAPRGAGERDVDADGDASYAARLKGYASGGPVKYAVEVRGGTVARLGVKPGDVVVLTGIGRGERP